MTGERAAGSADSGSATADQSPEAGVRTPSDAFQGLGNETRMAVLRALAESEPRSFSSLFDASGEDTSAGFAYHLRQLVGEFVRKRDDERYELTYAGREVARAIRAGTYTDSVDRGPVPLDDDCPFCGRAELRATVEDNVTKIACDACESPLLAMTFPPSGYATRDEEDLPAAFDSYHRRRIGAFGDGVCPDCGGVASASVDPLTESADGPSADDATDDAPIRVQATFACEECGADLRCPVSLTVLDHPAVVAFYHEHDRDVADRPIWNVGSEWRERVLSRDPWCVGVSVRLDGDELRLYVARDGRVVEHRRRELSDDVDEGVESADGTVRRQSATDEQPGEDGTDEATA